MKLLNLVVALLLSLRQDCVFSFSAPFSDSRFCCRRTTHALPLQTQSTPVLSTDEQVYTSDESIIASAASLLSYQCAEEQLQKALNDFAPEKSNITYHLRGQLEDFTNDNLANKGINIVDSFLLSLSSLFHGKKCLDTGLTTCRTLLNHAGGPCHFKPPTRSLIGTIDGMDISLLRDKEDVHRRFTMLLSQDRAKGRKIARLHAELDEQGIVSIRGLHVHEHHRSKGLSTQLIALFCQFCFQSFGSYPQTCFMNKPLLCVALASLGFTPESEQWPALVAPHESNPQITLMSSTPHGPHLGPQFPHAVRKAQQIQLVEHCLEENHPARAIHVLTKFQPPKSRECVEKRLETCPSTWYSARIVAFLSTLDYGKGPMWAKCKALAR
jgi:hypothetical protein